MTKNIYITTPAYYPSAKPHLGTAYSTVLADVLARYHRMVGNKTYFLTGLDEHGQKIEINAEKAGQKPQQFVDGIAKIFSSLWSTLKISNDDLIRTTEERHIKVVQSVFSKLLKNDDIYLGKYEGWYCIHDESFWTNSQLLEGNLCPECGRPVVKQEEETFFFKTNKYLDRLIKHYETHPDFLTPINRKNEMFNTFINKGLHDLSVSRTSFSWGIPINEKKDHVVYVWLDALVNYISALGYDSIDDHLFVEFWKKGHVLHLLGADITRFHAIYWPMFLMALDLKIPERLFVHGLLMTKDGKMSKSRNNAIDPVDLINLYGVDKLRYYYVKEIRFGDDGIFSPEQFIEKTNADLVNNYGNLLNRTLNMIKKYFNGIIPSFKEGVNPEDKALTELSIKTVGEYQELMNNLKVTEATQVVIDLLSASNKYIDDTAPFLLFKNGKIDETASVMAHLARNLLIASFLLSPILVEGTIEALRQLGLSKQEIDFKNILDSHFLDNRVIQTPTPLYPRLDPNLDLEKIKEVIQIK